MNRRLNTPSRTALLATSLWAAVVMAPNALAGGDAQAGKEKSATCEACHGADGLGTNPMYPVLAGQYEDYLVHALKSYRDGTRKNAIMAGLAAALSDEDIEDLAAYYASMPSALYTLPDR
ncbi:MAG: cytochrome c [Xanthomonadales bacterium]|jgi:cytochrome c553|nr:cytochrome c [Xanthomonadales bacterium]